MARWEVLLGPPYSRWLDNDQPSLEKHIAFWEWVLACIADGPPGPKEGAVQTLDDEPLFLYRLPPSGLVVTYYVFTHELLVQIKEIG